VPPHRWELRLVALALAGATFLAYLPVLANEFVNYDDDLYITGVRQVRAGLTREGVAWAFTTFQGANWFPLTRLSWMLDAQLFGLEPAAFHATSLLLHVANALLLLLALCALSGALWPSAFVAGVFALHPLHVESVAWAAARKDLLSGLFFALALLAHARVARRDSPSARFALALCMALGLMAKPMLVTLPFVLLLLDAWPLARLGSRGLDANRARRALLEKLPLFVLAAAASAVTLVAQRAGGALQTLDHVPFGSRAANAAVAAVRYVVRAIWPADLAVFYPLPRDDLGPGLVAAAALVLAGATALALLAFRRRPWWAVGWLWFAGMLVPVIGLVQVGGQAMADRYTYLPLVGLALALAFEARARATSPRRRALLAALAVAALAALSVATFRQAATWRTSETLFRQALSSTRDNAVAHINLGLALARSGRAAEGALHAREALRIAPGHANAHALLAELRALEGRHDEALAAYRRALALRPGTVRWHVAIGRSLRALGRSERALAELEVAHSLAPGDPHVHAELGLTLFEARRVAEALAHWDEALRLDPGLPEVHGYRGVALLERGDAVGALAGLERAAAARPDTALWHARLGGALAALGREREATAAYERALALDAQDMAALNNLAWILAASSEPGLRDPARAVVLARRAASGSGAASPDVLDTLAVAYAAAGRPSEAVGTAERALALAEAQGRAGLAAELRARLVVYRRRAEGGSRQGSP
jgi:tetratricopeptide (TPR) repeat protein